MAVLVDGRELDVRELVAGQDQGVQTTLLFDVGAQARRNAGIERNRDASHVRPFAAQALAMLGDALGQAGPIGEPRVAFAGALASVVGAGGALGVFGGHAFDAEGDQAVARRDARRGVDARRVRWTDEHGRGLVRALVHTELGAVFAVDHQIQVFDRVRAARDEDGARSLRADRPRPPRDRRPRPLPRPRFRSRVRGETRPGCWACRRLCRRPAPRARGVTEAAVGAQPALPRRAPRAAAQASARSFIARRLPARCGRSARPRAARPGLRLGCRPRAWRARAPCAQNETALPVAVAEPRGSLAERVRAHRQRQAPRPRRAAARAARCSKRLARLRAATRSCPGHRASCKSARSAA